ncbi:MAG: hypothetical protein K2L51_05385 [Clostridiales bacterium]|nr:hypothetical protein [Clostridiales bacterium]
MKEIDVHRLIEAQDEEKKAEIWQKVQAKLALDTQAATEKAVKTPPKKIGKKKVIGFVSLAAVCACVLCLAILLPVLLKKEAVPQERYCSQQDYDNTFQTQTLQEYALTNGIDLLYVDMYAQADDVLTTFHFNKNDATDLIFMEETIANGETGDFITLYITDTFTSVEGLQWIVKFSIDDEVVKSTPVKWGHSSKMHCATFTYGQYRYYIELPQPSEVTLQEVLENILP